jgi:hypothetical protein
MFLTSWKLALLTCATLPFMLLQFRAFARECIVNLEGGPLGLCSAFKAKNQLFSCVQQQLPPAMHACCTNGIPMHYCNTASTAVALCVCYM